ncbi:RES family NAD+ phosphorylase [Brevibacterium sp. VCM10]|uniref:RES family NAD+ phosphorylase n=1 Tax=Brevibacterium sp. VCM10 TaxID=1381751 RepID=UPI0018CC268E|nr:RES family NAD+ phosphorylase [Brevibacterium sp. VCM10]
MRFAPEDLECPEPDQCPVATEALTSLARGRSLPTYTISVGITWHRLYSSQFGQTEANPGLGDARFSPFNEEGTNRRVPTLYLAETPHAALLETVLRDVGEWEIREVSETQFYGQQLHVGLETVEALHVADLRNPEMAALGIGRSAIASSSQEHYPCTRTVARAIHASQQNLAGIVWHSRQTEISGRPDAEALVLFADRLANGRDALALTLSLTSVGATGEGAGRIKLDELLEDVAVTVVSPLE